MLQFDETTAALLEDAYQGSDFAMRRRANFDALGARRGETVLDLGCGNGLLTLDLSRAVGPQGQAIGIDPSAAMLDAARARCAGRGNTRLIEAGAQALPLDDASLDRAVSLQVFEYFNDCAGPLAELHRCLRPGGRLVLGDMHFGTLAWFSDDPGRMDRMRRAWDRHVADPALPARLPAHLHDAGFRGVEMAPLTFCDTVLRPDGLARMMIHLMTAYAVQNGHVERPEAEAWAAEQGDLARAGRFFFALTHFVCTATRR